jgi:hypothetical protein
MIVLVVFFDAVVVYWDSIAHRENEEIDLCVDDAVNFVHQPHCRDVYVHIVVAAPRKCNGAVVHADIVDTAIYRVIVGIFEVYLDIENQVSVFVDMAYVDTGVQVDDDDVVCHDAAVCHDVVDTVEHQATVYVHAVYVDIGYSVSVCRDAVVCLDGEHVLSACLDIVV